MAAGSQRDRVIEACGAKPGSAEDYPFGDGVAVFKVGGRMFALVSLEGDRGSVNLKCDPALALELETAPVSPLRSMHRRRGHHQAETRPGAAVSRDSAVLVDRGLDLGRSPIGA